MKFYEKHDAYETLKALLSSYDKQSLSKNFSNLAVNSLKNDGSISLPDFDMTIIKQNGKYAIKIGNEE